MEKDLLIEAREAIVVLLNFYEDITCAEAIPSFIADPAKLKEFANHYDLEFVYKIYEKLRRLKG